VPVRLSPADRRLRIASRMIAAVIVSMSLAATGLSIALKDTPSAVGGIILISFPIVAVMITRVQPRNGVAWVFLAASFLDRLNQLGDRLARFAVLHRWPDSIAHTGALVTICGSLRCSCRSPSGFSISPTDDCPAAHGVYSRSRRLPSWPVE
jgi:hypothetical protein